MKARSILSLIAERNSQTTQVIDQLREIVGAKQAKKVNTKTGRELVDLTSASAMVKVYDALSPKNREKVDTELALGNDGLVWFAKVAFHTLQSAKQKF